MPYFSTKIFLVNTCWLLLTLEPIEKWKKCHFSQFQGKFKVKILTHKVNKCWPKFFYVKVWCLSFLKTCQPSFFEVWWRFWRNLNFCIKINIFQNYEKFENMMIIHNFMNFVFWIIWGWLTRLWKAETSNFSTKKFGQHLLTFVDFWNKWKMRKSRF